MKKRVVVLCLSIMSLEAAQRARLKSIEPLAILAEETQSPRPCEVTGPREIMSPQSREAQLYPTVFSYDSDDDVPEVIIDVQQVHLQMQQHPNLHIEIPQEDEVVSPCSNAPLSSRNFYDYSDSSDDTVQSPVVKAIMLACNKALQERAVQLQQQATPSSK